MKAFMRGAVAGVAVAACVLVAACGGPSGSAGTSASTGASTTAAPSGSVTIDGKQYEVDGPLRLGVFIAQGGNGYATALLDGFKQAVAAIPGASVTTFDGRSDPTAQLNQLENALASGKYNTMLIAPLSDLATGAVAALKSAGKQGSLKVFDVAGNRWDQQALKAGDLEATAPTLRSTEGRTIVQSFADARAGEAIPHMILNDGAPRPSGAPPSGLVIVTRADVDSFTPEF